MKTILDLTVTYIDHLRSLNYSPRTLDQVRLRLNNFSKWFKATLHIEYANALCLEDLKRWHTHAAAAKNVKGHPAKATSINRNISVIRGFITYLSDNNYIQPRFLKALPRLKEPRPLPGSVLPHARVMRLLSSIATDTSYGYRDRAICELLYSSGIRSFEILKLNVTDIDFKNKTAFICGKGGKERIVPIGKTALRYLESYVTGIRPFIIKDTNETALFVNKRGCRLNYDNFRVIIRNAVRQSGLEEYISPYTFRRSCTTELIRSGANMYHVKELLGHESLETLKHYAKLTITDLKKTHKKCHPREREDD